MKRIILSIAIFLAAQIGFAQEEVVIEQNINQRINKLEIYSGWDVHLIHHEADSGYRVAIITEEDLAARAYNVQLCNVKDSTLTILENTQLPRGTVVEIEGPMTFGSINLFERATAEADYVVASAASLLEERTDLFLSKYSSFHVQHYHMSDPDNSRYMEIRDHAQLTIDTISGKGKAVVNTYEGVFRYGSYTLEGTIMVSTFENTSDPSYIPKDCRIIKTKEVDGELVTTERKKTWNDVLYIAASFGYRLGANPKNAESPLLQNGTLSVNFDMTTSYSFSKRLGLKTGIRMNTNWKYLSHQVSYEADALVVTDGQGDFQRNRLESAYIGIPVSLSYYLGKRQTESFSLDLFCGRLFGEVLNTSIDPTKSIGFKNWTKEYIDGVFNPWQLEVGLSFNTQHLGIIHGVRVFTNLLPEYKPGVTTDKFRSVGVEIKL